MPEDTLAAQVVDTGVTVPINTASSGDTTLHTPVSGTKFVVMRVNLRVATPVDILFKSGSTALTGGIPVSATVPLDLSNAGGYPELIGRAKDDALVINLGAAVQVDGYAVVADSRKV